MPLKGALHVHSEASDGSLPVKEVVRVHEESGFDFICLTDHDFLVKPNCYKKVRKIRTEMIVFLGVELTVYEKGYIHVSRIQGDKEVLHIFNHPSELDLPLDKVKERIASVGLKYPLDAIEITSKGYPTPEYDVPEIPLSKVATDDSHTRRMIGRAWVEVESTRDKDSIIRAIREGRFRNCYANE